MMSQLYGYKTIVSDPQDFWKIKSMHTHFFYLFPRPPDSSHQNTHFPPNVHNWNSIWNTEPLEGAGGHRRSKDRKNFVSQKMCRQCSSKYTLWCHICSDSPQDFWEVKHMCKQRIPGSLFCHPLRAGYEVKDQREYLAPTISQRQYPATLISYVSLF